MPAQQMFGAVLEKLILSVCLSVFLDVPLCFHCILPPLLHGEALRILHKCVQTLPPSLFDDSDPSLLTVRLNSLCPVPPNSTQLTELITQVTTGYAASTQSQTLWRTGTEVHILLFLVF